MDNSINREQRQYRRLFALCFAVFFVVALVSRLLPRRWRPFDAGGAKSRSIVGDARAAASASVPFVFMN